MRCSTYTNRLHKTTRTDYTHIHTQTDYTHTSGRKDSLNRFSSDLSHDDALSSQVLITQAEEVIDDKRCTGETHTSSKKDNLRSQQHHNCPPNMGMEKNLKPNTLPFPQETR
jgi:hypothetical protein